MSTIKITITVEKLSNVLTLFDVIKVYRSTTGENGVYSEITGVGTRVSLVSGQSVYTYDDTSGDPDYYYKTSYYHETTTLESSLSDPIKGDQSSLYIDVDDIRSEGVTVSMASDDKILELIGVWQQFIENQTRNWFIPKEMVLEFDGNGTNLLQLPFPIISVTSLTIDEEEIDTSYYKVYSGRGENNLDNRKNPRIKIIKNDTSIFTGVGSVRYKNSLLFYVGEGNVVIDGVFGYTESDGSVPKPIIYALKKLVVKNSTPMVGSINPAGPVIEEETDRHRRKWSNPFMNSKVWTITGDQEVDQIIASYKSPLIVKAPRTMNSRPTGGRIIV